MGALRAMVSNHEQDAPPVRTRSLYIISFDKLRNRTNSGTEIMLSLPKDKRLL